MDIKKYIKNKTGVNLPISGGDGQTLDKPVKINSEYKNLLIDVENDFISLWLDEGKWKKDKQELLFLDNGIKIDKISIHFIDDNGLRSKKVFWFDITDCF